MKRFFIGAFLSTVLLACGGNSEQPEQQQLPAPGKDTLTLAEKKARGTQILLAKDTIVLPALKDSIVAEAYMPGMGRHVVFAIDVQKGESLYVQLLAQDTANIRVNQVYNPAGEADGPFQKELLFPIKSHGTYKLVVAENQMAAQEWKGDFKIKIALR
ncbi:hypothetical protein [Foetidibacter luteolus]|uniref:hypothetical protein n=1 Tax=Foetidibacter luteolus TaxID=2608880 RepID=UPI00129B7173|nr:hypothetical protein [Foetidibacter luteolus]